MLGLEPVKGGNWFTGYHQHNGEWYLFPGVGTTGRTGHDYENEWIDGDLHWSGRSESNASHPSIQQLTSLNARVHLFTREENRSPFTYHGKVVARSVDPNSIPVRVVWRLVSPESQSSIPLPEEVKVTGFKEGAVRTVTVNAYERSAHARSACLKHHGTFCAACGVDLGQKYGPIAEGHIHVHHLKPIAELAGEYTVDPISDLVPVCPNCHAVIHLREPPLSLLEIRSLLSESSGK